MRRVGTWIAIVLVGLAVALLAASKIVHFAWNHERSAASISRWSSQQISGDGPSHQAFTFGRVDYPWLPAVRSLFWGPPVRFDAWEIAIWDPDGREVIYAPHVQAGLRLDKLVWAQLRGFLPWQKSDVELHFVDVVIDTVRCRIADARNGRVNLVAAFAGRSSTPSTAPPTGDGMVVSAEGTRVGDGSFQMEFHGWQGVIEHFEMRLDSLRYSSFQSEQQVDRPAFTYHVSRVVAPRGSATIGDYTFPLDHIVATGFSAENPARQDVVMKSVAHSLGAEISVDGRLTNTYSDHAGVDVRIDARHGRHVLALFSTKQNLTGDASITAHLTGPFSNVVIEGAAHGADVRIRELEAHHVAARYRFASGTLRLHDLSSDVAGGHVRGDVTLEFKARLWRADMHLTDINLIQPGPLLPVGILAYMVGPFQSLARGDSVGEESAHLSVRGVDVTLFRHLVDKLPHRVVLRGNL